MKKHLAYGEMAALKHLTDPQNKHTCFMMLDMILASMCHLPELQDCSLFSSSAILEYMYSFPSSPHILSAQPQC